MAKYRLIYKNHLLPYVLIPFEQKEYLKYLFPKKKKAEIYQFVKTLDQTTKDKIDKEMTYLNYIVNDQLSYVINNFIVPLKELQTFEEILVARVVPTRMSYIHAMGELAVLKRVENANGLIRYYAWCQASNFAYNFRSKNKLLAEKCMYMPDYCFRNCKEIAEKDHKQWKYLSDLEKAKYALQFKKYFYNFKIKIYTFARSQSISVTTLLYLKKYSYNIDNKALKVLLL